MNNDLISRTALLHVVRQCKEAVNECANHDYMVGYASALSGVEEQIAESPAVDAEPVWHGRWIGRPTSIKYISNYECSACGSWQGVYWMNYCPHCGAKMDAEERERYE